MTTNDFNDLAEERDRYLARSLYHHIALVRSSVREWAFTELKELELEAERLCSVVSTAQRGALERCQTQLKEIETSTQSRFSSDEDAEFDAAMNAVFGHVYEPASGVQSEVDALVEIIAALKECREEVEAIAGTVSP